MDLIYITERIIAMTFPAGNTEDSYKTALKEVTQMLKTKHSENYMVFNLSERRNDVSKLNKQVFDFGWPLHLAPPLERLCSICKAMDSWLNSGPHHIVVLHSKGGKERARVVVAAYMHYSNISASADQALDRFAMKKFFNEKLHGLLPPSQKRYIEYFGGLLSGSIKINNSPLYLQQVFIQGTPNCDYKGGCRLFIKVYQGMQQIFTSGVYSVSSSMQCVPITLDSPLQLRGDILVTAYHRRVKPDGRNVIFRCQFHTCAITEYTLEFSKEQLDEACQDEKFPQLGRVELRFSSVAERHYNAFQDLSVPVDYSLDNIVRWDSYENFDALPEDTLNETGDLDLSTSQDGSLYATVAKRPMNGGFPHHATNGVSSSGPPEIIHHGLHTVSMDSGISSTSGPHAATGSTPPHSHGTQSTASTSDPLTLTPTPTNLFETHVEVHRQPEGRPRPSRENSTTNALPDSKEQRKLDELLSGMLADVESMPDIKTTAPANAGKQATYNQPPLTNGYGHGSGSGSGSGGTRKPLVNDGLPEATDDEDRELVYHARKDSQPFTYGVPPASPRLHRRVFPATSSVTTTTVIKRDPTPLSNGINYNPGLTNSVNNNVDGGTSYATLPKNDDSVSFDLSPGLDSSRCDERGAWLQRQQQKLRDRNEARMRGERLPKEQQLISELRNTQQRLNVYREDPGYNTPLHVHTTNGHWQKPPSPAIGAPAPQKSSAGSAPSSPIIPSRGSSREVTRGRYGTWQTPATGNKPLQRQRSDSSHDRPFVAVKRAHEQSKRQAELQGTNPLLNAPNIYSNTYIYAHHNYPQHQQQQVSSSSAPPKAQTPTGLLTTVEPRTSSPVTARELDDLEMTLRAVTTQTPQHQSTPVSSGRSVSPILGRNKILDLNYSQSGPDGSSSPQYSPSTPGGDRPATPAFPVYPKTPYFNQESTPPPQGVVIGLPPKSPTLSRKERSPSPATVQQLRANLSGGHHYPSNLDGSLPLTNVSHTTNGQSSPTVYFGQSRRSSLISLTEPLEIIHHHPLFVKDLSKYWYKPNISREDAISMLKDSSPGTFLVRNSNSFPGAFGLALKVATPPPNVQGKTGDISNELVRHFLIEMTDKGVKMKGSTSEPVFGSLSALVYQHSITPLSLPCKLILPEADPSSTNGDITDSINNSASAQLLIQGAACNVLYLFTMDTESLTGPQAVRKAAATLLKTHPLPNATVVHFKVSNQGITLTDNNRKLFFRRHYPVNTITHCGIDPDDRRWSQRTEDIGVVVINNQIFGFVARKPASKTDNQCHIFAELEPEQPASAIVNFVTKVMMVPLNTNSAFI